MVPGLPGAPIRCLTVPVCPEYHLAVQLQLAYAQSLLWFEISLWKVCHKAGATSSDETSSTRAVVPYTLPEKSKKPSTGSISAIGEWYSNFLLFQRFSAFSQERYWTALSAQSHWDNRYTLPARLYRVLQGQHTFSGDLPALYCQGESPET